MYGNDLQRGEQELTHQEIEMPVINQNQSQMLKDVGFNERQGFVVKVYGIITLQLFVTCLLTTMAYANPGFRHALYTPETNNLTAFVWLCFVVSIITEIAIFCCKNVSRKVPNNYIALGLFTLTFSVVVAASCSSVMDNFSNGAELVLCAAFLTLGVTVALTLYAFTCKSDFTVFGGLLWMCAWSLFAMFVVLIFFPSVILYFLVSCVSSLVYGVYLIYDTQLIAGGRTYELSIDDYIIGALMVYIDVIVLFLRILRILVILFGKK